MKKQYLKFKTVLIAIIALGVNACGENGTLEENLETRDLLESTMLDTTTWLIDDYQITVNGEAFFGNGVSYSPVPWGDCSAFNPFGDFTINTWSSVWDRDVKLMRENGVNLLKTYNTLDSAQLVDAGDPSTWDHNHTNFLDSCWNGGVDPIYVLMGYAPPKNNLSIFFSDVWDDSSNVAAREMIKTNLVTLASDWGSHPAVMGFVMANEINAVNTIDDSLFFKFWNDVALAMGVVAPGKLVSLANADDSMGAVDSGNVYMTAPNFFWGYNSYRGNWTNSNGFDDLFSTFATATASNKHPLMLTEWGAPASTHGALGTMENLDSTQMAHLVNYVGGHYANMLANRSDNSSGVCCGGTYFEWTDELWKADPAGYQCNESTAAPSCNTGIWNPSVKVVPNFPGGYWDEEGFGLFSITPVDTSIRVPVKAGGCIGPWNPVTSSPYLPDVLKMRPSGDTLFKAMQNSQL
jgi:hypothetical protein